MPKAYKKNHTISQCLLERFADGAGKLDKHFCDTGRTVSRASGLEGFRKKLWTPSSAKTLEEAWNKQAESDIRPVFKKLDAGEPLTVGDKGILTRFCAIHYVRSEEFIRVYELHVREPKCRAVNLAPSWSFSDRYFLRCKLLRETKIPSIFFEGQMQQMYEKCLSYLSEFGLEVGTATGSVNFILPDGGLYLHDSATGHAQPSNGVSLLQADTSLLPLGPRHIVAFTARTRDITYRDLSDSEVGRANSHLQQAAIYAYFTQPHN